MKINYCLPIIKNKKSDVLETIKENKNDYQYFEVWLDYVENVDENFIEELKKLLQEKLILLFRRQNLEEIKMQKEERLEIISLLNNSESLVDLDIFSQKEELEYIKNNKLHIQTIISYHNYDKTPADEDLKDILYNMNHYNPTIFKVATMCNTENDAVRLLQLLADLKKEKVKYIVLGMGKQGIITRIFGTLWGNEIIFAPRNKKEQTAPGQLTRQQLETMLSLIQDS